jgi:hypothetical protein
VKPVDQEEDEGCLIEDNRSDDLSPEHHNLADE